MRLGKHVAVVGAGVVGLAIALRLRRDGYRVTLYDPNEPGSQTSAGNAAIIMTAQATPSADPALLRKLPALLRRKDGPLAVRMGHLPKMLPWLWLFFKQNSRSHRNQTAETLAPLALNSFRLWMDLAGPLDAPRHFRQSGMLQVYKTPKAFRAAQREAELRGEYDVPYEVVHAEEMRQLEPELRDGLAGAILYTDVAHCWDPRKLSDMISGHFRTSGGEVRRLHVRQLKPVDRNTISVVTEEGNDSYDEVVLAAGISSPALLKPLGVKPKIASERGYHLNLQEPGISINRPVIAGEGRFAITPLENAIRIAGTSEFAHPEAIPDWDRSDRLFDQAQELLPALDGDGNASRWCATRDSTPDGLPCVGRLKKHRNILCAFGHGHMGLTLAATTAEFIADLISKREPFLDIKPLSPDRF